MNLGESKRLILKAIEGDNTHAPFWCSLAVLSHQIGDFDTALDYSKRAVDLDEKLPEALYNYAVLLELKCRETDALQYYQKLVKL